MLKTALTIIQSIDQSINQPQIKGFIIYLAVKYWNFPVIIINFDIITNLGTIFFFISAFKRKNKNNNVNKVYNK